MANGFKAGSYTGTGAAITIELGWVPDFVIVWNATDGDARWEWFNGMGAADALAIANHDSTQLSLITSNGIDAFTGTAGDKSAGFTVGSALSESAKVFRYAAFRAVD
ncbi:hypothetical protein [Sphingopyxis flava]|uniref:Uncharacterized protein n=1 Tax=Sphingopyxis flava TaxID=1507287 RepID=A0A1T5ABN4_9SPHN|nr:hypothetical protein [Sphingopyxis flava]SKB32392.1 hypothetical protein SAMN06295937_100376 [Sphingopyxis flava]